MEAIEFYLRDYSKKCSNEYVHRKESEKDRRIETLIWFREELSSFCICMISEESLTKTLCKALTVPQMATINPQIDAKATRRGLKWAELVLGEWGWGKGF